MRFAISLTRGQSLLAQPNVQLITSDIDNFWNAYNQSEAGNRTQALQKLYLEQGSIGLQESVRVRVGSAQQL